MCGAILAQLVEQCFCKAKVLGSNPRDGSVAEVAEWSIARDCKSRGRKACVGSNPTLSTDEVKKFIQHPNRVDSGRKSLTRKIRTKR